MRTRHAQTLPDQSAPILLSVSCELQIWLWTAGIPLFSTQCLPFFPLILGFTAAATPEVTVWAHSVLELSTRFRAWCLGVAWGFGGLVFQIWRGDFHGPESDWVMGYFS